MTKNFTKIMTRAVMTLLLMVFAATTAWAQSALEEDVVVFEDAADNSDAIEALDGQTKTVVIKGRTLKAGHWNPIRLPFALSEEQMEEFFGAGAMAAWLSSYSVEGTTVKIVFGNQGEMRACIPYFVFIPEGADIIDPVFRNVRIANLRFPIRAGIGAALYGNYYPKTLEAGNKKVLYLKDDNFCYPTEDVTINAFQTYVKLDEELPASANIIVDWGNGESTAIESVNSTDGTDGTWYTLTGIQLEGEPTAPGIYVKDGKKVAIQ